MKILVQADVSRESVRLLGGRTSTEQHDDDNQTFCEVTHVS